MVEGIKKESVVFYYRNTVYIAYADCRDYHWHCFVCCSKVQKNTDNGPIMPDHLKHYYIEYDEWGVIYNVYASCQPGG